MAPSRRRTLQRSFLHALVPEFGLVRPHEHGGVRGRSGTDPPDHRPQRRPPPGCRPARLVGHAKRYPTPQITRTAHSVTRWRDLAHLGTKRSRATPPSELTPSKVELVLRAPYQPAILEVKFPIGVAKDYSWLSTETVDLFIHFRSSECFSHYPHSHPVR